jgi:hypothetical protein
MVKYLSGFWRLDLALCNPSRFLLAVPEKTWLSSYQTTAHIVLSNVVNALNGAVSSAPDR